MLALVLGAWPITGVGWEEETQECSPVQLAKLDKFAECAETYVFSGSEGKTYCDGGFDSCVREAQSRAALELQEGDDCVDCNKTDWGEVIVGSLGMIAGPLAHYGVNKQWAVAHRRVGEARWQAFGDHAAAMAEFPQACVNGFNSYLDHRTQLGINSALSVDGAGSFFDQCSNLSQYAGFGGQFSNGYGGSGNPWLGAGYSGGFMSGMVGPGYHGSGGFSHYGGMGGNLGLGLLGAGMAGGLLGGGGIHAGISVGGGYPGMYPGGGMGGGGFPGMYPGGGMGGGISMGGGFPGMYPGGGMGGGISMGGGFPGMYPGGGMGGRYLHGRGVSWYVSRWRHGGRYLHRRGRISWHVSHGDVSWHEHRGRLLSRFSSGNFWGQSPWVLGRSRGHEPLDERWGKLF